jgi:predicted RNA-binding Zn-ribbon protein involved in translation (DUF1610 family)
MSVNNAKRKSQLRCLNCFERFEPADGATEAVCPKCQMAWRLSWPSRDSVKIRGPVWKTVE